MVHKRDIGLEAVLSLISGKKHLRELSRELEVSHTTLSRRIDELIKLNVLDYEIVGRNKVFFLKNNLISRNYFLNAERYKVLKFSEKYSFMSILLEDILNLTNGFLVLIFGSYAKFSSNKKSDLDLYINTDSKKLKQKIEDLDSRLNVKIGRWDDNSLLIKEIIKNHVIVRGEEDFYEKISN